MTTSIYIVNKYHTLYNNIINNAISKNRYKSKSNYYENHHIHPKALGGGDEPENMVLLTGREHYICHYLLTKFTNSGKMIFAFHKMNFSSKGQDRHINSILYESNKIRMSHEVSKIHTGRKCSQETKDKISKGNLGKKHTQETKDKLRKLKTGSTHSEETKKKMSISRTGLTRTDEYKIKFSKSRLGTNHPMNSGYWITPVGKFNTSKEASKQLNISDKSIRNWCKLNNNKIITNIHQSKYLKALLISPIGKTYNEIGFNFQEI